MYSKYRAIVSHIHYFYQENKSPRDSTACIDPLSPLLEIHSMFRTDRLSLCSQQLPLNKQTSNK